MQHISRVQHEAAKLRTESENCQQKGGGAGGEMLPASSSLLPVLVNPLRVLGDKFPRELKSIKLLYDSYNLLGIY